MKGLSILALNVRSLYPKLDELYIRFCDYDFLCFSETWTNSSHTNEMLSLPGFDLFRLDRGIVGQSKKGVKCTKRGGGLAIYAKKEFGEFLNVYDSGCKTSVNLEQLFVILDKPNVKKSVLGVVYRPPGGKNSEGIDELSTTLRSLEKDFQGEITVVGDFNINYNLRHSNAFKLIKYMEREFNLNQIIKTSTRVTQNTSNCIDLIFTNMEYIKEYGTLDMSISDHLPTYLVKKKAKLSPQYTTFWGRSYVNYNKDAFQRDIKSHHLWYKFWEEGEENPESLWQIFLTIITEVADIHCPFKRMKFRDDSPEWITREMVQEISHKDYLYKRAKHSHDPNDWDLFHKKKNEVKKLLSSAKEEFIKDKLEEYGNNPRKFWRTINEMSGIGKNKKRGTGCTKLLDDNGVVYENIEAAEYLNKYYVNVGPNLANKLNADWDKTKCKIDVDSVFNFVWINEREVVDLVKNIKISKSSAIDGLSTRILKDAFLVSHLELTYMYNLCLSNGVFPETWCISMVTPIPKTNSKSTNAGDWRPISQICLTGKLLEKIVHTQLYNYLQLNNILSEKQFGFRKGLSTSLAIFEVLKELYSNWNDKNFSGCVFIDFSRAFDSINHNILFQKLEMYGLDPKPIDFFKKYMGNRTQRTKINGHTSEKAQVTCGTAQGSILGPLIFILYINDIFKSIDTDGQIYMYADDTLIVCKSNDIDIVTSKVQDSLNKMLIWCNANKLSMNLKKTKHLTVKHTKPDHESPVLVNNNTIGTVQTYEYLGMILDNKLSMNEQVESMWKKANTKVGILSKVRRFISMKTAINIYKCMIRPHLDYIDFVVDSSASDRILKLDRLQEKAIRRIEYCVDRKRRKKVDVLQEEFNIEPLLLRRQRNLVKIIYKTSKNDVNVEHERPKMDLRSKPKVKLKSKFTGITKVHNSPLYRGMRLWDKLPAKLQNEENKIRFKVEINRFQWNLQ